MKTAYQAYRKPTVSGNLFDLTAYRIKRTFMALPDSDQRKKILMKIFEQYIDGDVVVAWQNGAIKVTLHGA